MAPGEAESSPTYTTEKKPDPDPLKSGSDRFFLTVYTGNKKVRLMIEECNSTHARNHRKARQAHMKKMVRNEDALTQRFRTAKGGRTGFFRFWSHCRLWPQNQKKASPDPFHENMVRKVYTAKISGLYQLFCVSWPIFFCSVNGALDFGLQGWIGTLGLEQIFLTLIEVIKLCLTCTGEATKRGTWTDK